MKVERDRWSAAQYRSLIEQIPAIVYIDAVDEEMSTTYISPQIERLLGVMPQARARTQKMIESVLLGQATSQAALDAAAADMNDQIDKYNKANK